MDAKTLLGIGAIGGAVYLATSKKAQAKVKKTTGLSNKPKRRRKALIFTNTKDSDLRIGQEVLVASFGGNIDLGHDMNYKRGIIRKVVFDDYSGVLEYDIGNGLGRYMANELIIIKGKLKKQLG